jgi:hypothetical protein
VRAIAFAVALSLSLAAVAQAQTPRTYDDPVPRDQSSLTRERVLAAFERLAYGETPVADSPGRLTRWNRDEVGVHWEGTLGRNDIHGERPGYAEIHAFIDELDDVEGVPRLRTFFNSTSFDIWVYLVARSELKGKLEQFDDDYRAWWAQDCGVADGQDGPVIFIKYDFGIPKVRSCIVSMMIKSMGFIGTGDVEELEGSAIDMTPDYPYLTNLDYYLLRVLYDPRYDPAMPRDAGMAAASLVVVDLITAN